MLALLLSGSLILSLSFGVVLVTTVVFLFVSAHFLVVYSIDDGVSVPVLVGSTFVAVVDSVLGATFTVGVASNSKAVASKSVMISVLLVARHSIDAVMYAQQL